MSVRERLDMKRFSLSRATERSRLLSGAHRAPHARPTQEFDEVSACCLSSTAECSAYLHLSSTECQFIRVGLVRLFSPQGGEQTSKNPDGASGGMGSLLRSEPMTLIQIIEAKGAARNVVNTLGDLGVVQFRDVRYR